MKIVILELLLLLALYFDLRYMKVPNMLNAIFIVLGIGLNIYNGTLLEGLAGGLLSFIVYFSVYTLVKKDIVVDSETQSLRIMGAGDGKLMITAGVIMGFNFTIIACIGVSIAWVLIIAPILYWKGSLLTILKETFKELKHRLIMLIIGKKVVVEAPNIQANTKIPFVTVIMVGINLAVIYAFI